MNNYQRIKLPYQLNELEDIISAETMKYHYNILHKNYELKLVKTLEETKIEEQFPTLEKLLENWGQLPEDLKEDIRFFGGGLINHNFYFLHLAKMDLDKNKKNQHEKKIKQELLEKIEKKFTSLEKLKEELMKNTLKVRGSGWTWLVLDKNNELKIINTANQDSPYLFHYRPLVAVDMWEHAYYLDYGTKKEKYVEKLLNYLLNWEYISKIYLHYISENFSYDEEEKVVV
jgi:Fe-Mn family superoxide dismutase